MWIYIYFFSLDLLIKEKVFEYCISGSFITILNQNLKCTGISFFGFEKENLHWWQTIFEGLCHRIMKTLLCILSQLLVLKKMPRVPVSQETRVVKYKGQILPKYSIWIWRYLIVRWCPMNKLNPDLVEIYFVLYSISSPQILLSVSSWWLCMYDPGRKEQKPLDVYAKSVYFQ